LHFVPTGAIRSSAALLGEPLAPLDLGGLFALESPALFRLSAVLLLEYKVLLELVHGATSFVHELAEVSGHLRELAGTEDNQEQEPYEHHLLDADTEHEA
jgi:hypothetical protein